jgi:hypothetical protein
VVLGLGTGLQRSACVVFDLGGGSTEVVSGLGGSPGRWTSLPFGAVTLTERYLHGNPPSAAGDRSAPGRRPRASYAAMCILPRALPPCSPAWAAPSRCSP